MTKDECQLFAALLMAQKLSANIGKVSLMMMTAVSQIPIFHQKINGLINGLTVNEHHLLYNLSVGVLVFRMTSMKEK